MKEIIPSPLRRLAQNLKSPLYVVGGSCRDYIAGLCSAGEDWDICAPASAEEIKLAAAEAGVDVTAVYPRTGTVRLAAEGKRYEFTSFRTDKYVRGTHSPEEVFFTRDITSDARRRDFKCNAVYYDILGGEFVDPLGGIDDIKREILDTVAPAVKVFGEDGLRLMRLCRIAAQTGFTPTRECLDGAIKNARLISDIAAERIRTELEYILAADKKYGVQGGHYRGLKLMQEVGLLGYILPELAAGDKMEQRKDFHKYDVLEHSLRCALYAPPKVRLAALLHDVGKPYCMNTFGRFAAHETEGARIARGILSRLRFPVKESERVCELIEWHMYDLSLLTREGKIRKFIVNHLGIFSDLLALKQADYSACMDDLSLAPCVEKWRAVYDKMMSEGVPMTTKQLDVRGDELIAAGLKAENAGKALSFLLGECAAGALDNKKQTLVRAALLRYPEN